MTGNRTKAGTDQLEGAYALETPANNVDYYSDFARTYDEGFVRDTGYVYPRLVAELFLAEAGPEDSPVLDVGAGTGLVAEHLAGCTVDAIDISPEMLEKAAAKGLYRNRVAADLTQPLELPDAAYGGLVSAGTFTHGHVGPQALRELLRVSRPGALFCLGINLGIFDSAGFGSAFSRLVAAGRITPVDFREIGFYERRDHEHSGDRGVVAVFRKR